MKKQFQILLLLVALIATGLAGCSSNRADNNQGNSDSLKQNGVPAEADSALKTNAKPVDTAGKDSTRAQRDSVHK